MCVHLSKPECGVNILQNISFSSRITVTSAVADIIIFMNGKKRRHICRIYTKNKKISSENFRLYWD